MRIVIYIIALVLLGLMTACTDSLICCGKLIKFSPERAAFPVQGGSVVFTADSPSWWIESVSLKSGGTTDFFDDNDGGTTVFRSSDDIIEGGQNYRDGESFTKDDIRVAKKHSEGI